MGSVSSYLDCTKTLCFSHSSKTSQLQRAAEEADEDEVGCGGWRRMATEGIPAAVGNMWKYGSGFKLSFQSTAFTFSNLVLRAQRPSVPHVRAAAGTEGLPGG